MDMVREKMEEKIASRVALGLQAERTRQAIHKKWLAREKSM